MSSCCKGVRPRYPRPRTCDRHRYHYVKPFVLISSTPSNNQTNVSPNIKAIKLIFGRDNINYRCLVNESTAIDMWQGVNNVPIRIKRGKYKCDGHLVILVIPVKRLLAGLTYKVRVKSVFVDRHGKSFKTCRLIVFTTGCR